MSDKEILEIVTTSLFEADIKLLEPFRFDQADEYIEKLYKSVPINCEIYSGASKLVIELYDADKVVKIPYSHYNATDQLLGADNSQNVWDYCRTEQELYLCALQRGIGCFFCPTDYLGEYQGHPIYTQMKCSSLTQVDVPLGTWQAELKEIYGEDMYKDYENFLIDYQISDLTISNVGYTCKDGLPVAFDYCSYNC